MNNRVKARRGKAHRLHALCPYFAMFPPSFVRKMLRAFTKPGDIVLDPFSGRGTTLLEALLLDRHAICGDVNPVAYCVSAAKADIPSESASLRELASLKAGYTKEAASASQTEAEELPQFFCHAFHSETLNQLLYLRRQLDWENRKVHRFLAAVLLGHLHGEMDRSSNYLSNQMPHTISTKPDYSVRYWDSRKLKAPRRDTFDLLSDRVKFRLEQGAPKHKGTAVKCDARRLAGRLNQRHETVAAVITSPPYLDITKFEEDQWLRLWFLGGSPRPTYGTVSNDDRHTSPDLYWRFLSEVWTGIAPLVKSDGHIICRIGARGIRPVDLTESVVASVQSAWPNCDLQRSRRSAIRGSQSAIFNPNAKGCRYEMDFVFAVGVTRAARIAANVNKGLAR